MNKSCENEVVETYNHIKNIITNLITDLILSPLLPLFLSSRSNIIIFLVK